MNTDDWGFPLKPEKTNWDLTEVEERLPLSESIFIERLIGKVLGNQGDLISFSTGLMPDDSDPDYPAYFRRHDFLEKFFRDIENKKLIEAFEVRYGHTGAGPLTYETQFYEFNILDREKLISYLRRELKSSQREWLERQNRKAESAENEYWITYNETREIKLNGKYRLSRPDFDTTNTEYFEYVFLHPNTTISLANLKLATGKMLSTSKELKHLIAELGFAGEIKKLFFPGVTKNKLVFRNPITRKIFKESGVNQKELTAQISRLNSKK